MIYRDLTQLARFPIDIYREPVRGFFTFVIPVGVMMSFPAKTLFGLLTWPFILYSFVLSWGVLYLSVRLWNFALRKYQSASS
jgi:ABC-2 type transport system permease protein